MAQDPADNKIAPPAAWAPAEWALCHFPQPAADREQVSMEDVVGMLDRLIDRCRDGDTLPLGQSLHTAHILKTMQGEDGRWPALLNLRTGEEIGEERSLAPVSLFRRLNVLLDSTEFEMACEFAARGGIGSSAPN